MACSSAPPVRTLLQSVPSATASPPGPALLERGAPQEREIRAGETHEYRIAAAAGDYARVSVDQDGVDVAVRLAGPAGEEVLAADGVGGKKEPELLSWIAGTGGSFRLAVSPHDPDGAGTYTVTLEELRPGVPGDDKRIAAERAFSEATHRKAQQGKESMIVAIAKFEEALPLWLEIGDLRQEVETLNRLGAVYRVLGETGKAVSIYERALSLALDSGDRRGEAVARNNLALAHQSLGDPQKALQLFREALAIWEELKDPKEMGITLFNLGNLHLRNGEISLALEKLNRALEIRRADGDLDTQAMILTAISSIRLTEGDPEAALALLAQALDISRQQKDRLSEANVLQNIARIHLLRGELQKALELFTETRDLYQALGALGPKAQVLSNLGATAVHLGDYDQALENYTEALEINQAMKNRTWEAYALWDIGALYELRGAPGLSLEHYDRALELGHAEGNHPVEALALLGIGRTRLALGQREEAVRHLEEALALFRSTGNALGEISATLELGRAWQALSELDRAAGLFQQALMLSRQRQALNNEAVAQAAVARLERDRGNLPAALEASEEALRIVETMRPKVAGQRLRVSFFASRRDYYELYIDIRMRMNEVDPGGGHLEEALAASERARARGLLDLLAEGRIDVRQGIASELKQRETEIGRRISWLQTRLIQELSGQGQGGAPTPEIEAELSRSEEELERLEWQIRREHPRYAAVSHPAPLALARIQELLDDRTALLEFSVGQERSFLFVVTRGGLAGFPLPPGDELAGLVETFRQAVAEPGRRLYNRYVETAYQLYRTLIEPAEPLLRDKPRLILSLEGPLLLLSFEALLTSEAPPGNRLYANLPYLILDRSVTYIPSASVLAELGRPRPAAPEPGDAKLFLGFGAPDYGAPDRVAQLASISPPEGSLERSLRDAGLPNPQPLPNARQEVASIAKLYPQDRVALYVGQQASEENVKDNPFLKTARQVHFAVHGFLNERQPELSGLVLTLDGDDREDGLLQVYEIFNLELQADLVVLSACDTGLGKSVSGEGLLGVTRALLYAGAASVAVSLWQVADTSTSDLMVRFYQHLSRNGDKAEALRLSKLEMIREGRFDRPYFWAPFILIGQPGRVAVTSSPPSRP